MAKINGKLKQAALIHRPSTDAELEQMIARMGQAQARVAAAVAEVDEAKASLDEALSIETAEDSAFIKAAHAGSIAYVEANRSRLRPKGKKTITLKSGTIEYRAGRLSITVKGASSVIAALEELGRNEFVTVKKSVNKDALLDYVREEGILSMPNVAGLTLKQGEGTLEIKPNAVVEDVGNG